MLGVTIPMNVKSPMMPKMKQPSRMRSGQGGRLGSLMFIGKPWLVDSRDEPRSASLATSGLPSSVPMIASTPSDTPLSKSPDLNAGVITLRMIRLDTTSVSVPSSP